MIDLVTTVMKAGTAVLSALLLALLSACWNLNSPVDPLADDFSGALSLRITDLTVTPSSADVSGVTPEQFSLIATFEDGSTRDVTEDARWRSSDQAVATVSNGPGTRGLATVAGSGIATIEAEYGGISTTRTNRCATFSADAIFVSATTGSDVTGDGARDAPVATVQKGVDLAAAIGSSAAVLVEAGAYLVTTPVVLAPDVSLYGGYEIGTWHRDTELYVSRIENTAASNPSAQSAPDAAVEAGPEITSGSRIDGLHLVGGGGMGPDGRYSAGVFCDGGSPTVVGNTIFGGTGIDHAYGVLVLNGGSPTIQGNTITGKTVRNGDRSYGIHVVDSSATVVGNVIDAGPRSPNRSAAVLFYGASSDGTIANNWIDGGLGREAVGIDLADGATARIWSNTVNAGTAQGGYGTGAAIAIAIDGGGPSIVNNVLFSDGGPVRYGVYEEAAGSDPIRFQSNVIFDTPTALYVDGGSSNYNTEADLNDWTVTTEDAGNPTDGNLFRDPVFEDRPGGDWRLSAGSPASVTEGGFDLSGESDYPTSGFPPEPIDYHGDERTVPWSIGAAEY
ncbi:MAG: right-handed parallel beta-helix repeat-containing protein [Spirochaetaceae bacterium]